MKPLLAEFLGIVLFAFWVAGIFVGVAVWNEYSKKLGGIIISATVLSYIILIYSLIEKIK
jgi:hypothetical protein